MYADWLVAGLAIERIELLATTGLFFRSPTQERDPAARCVSPMGRIV